MIETYPDAIRLKILDHIKETAPLLERLPGVAIVHDIRDGTVVFMTEKGQRLLGVSLEALQSMGTDYYQRFFNMEQAQEYVPQMLEMVRRNDPAETYTFFQQVRFAGNEEWQWHLSAIRIFIQDDDGKPVATLTQAHHLAAEHHYTRKVDRLLEELTFLKENLKTFEALGKREREVLKLMAEGKSAQEIAAALYISTHTVETHRKNIRRKLDIRNSKDIDDFARAFDLI